ncbi:MAG TPA: hypothetical protein VNN18_11495 [Candidatus Xenobia bacterium]|nr:hypothetical protein [Candidatus Xenobia bacterium]
MQHWKRFTEWGERKTREYYHRDKPFVLVLLVVFFLVSFAGTIQLVQKYEFLHTGRGLYNSILLLASIPLPMVRLYVQRRRVRRMISENKLSGQELLAELASSSFALVVSAYFILMFSVQTLGFVIRQSLSQ